MTTENTPAAHTPHIDGPNLVGLLALAELELHLRLTAALTDAPDPAFALRVATVSAGHLERARHYSGLARDARPARDGWDAAWKPSVDLLLDVPALNWLEGLTGAYVVAGVLTDLAELVPGTDADTSGAELAAAVREATEHDPGLVGRLSLFGRRVFGRVLLSGKRIEDTLLEPEKARVRAYFERAGEAFAERMSTMGLRG